MPEVPHEGAFLDGAAAADGGPRAPGLPERGLPERGPGAVLAVDIGGTALKGCVLRDNGQLVAARRAATRPESGAQPGLIESVARLLAELADDAAADGLQPAGIGVAVAGLVDSASGIVRYAANLGLRDAPIGSELALRTRLPVVIDHDVRAGALAEARLGAGRGAVRALFVPIGTGIAAAFVLAGRVDPGAHGASGELGHVAIRFGGAGQPARACPCGGRGCLEAYASAAAIGRQHPSGSAKMVAQLAAAGDQAAVALWRGAVEALADGLLIAIALYDPEVIVLGGGLSLAGQTLVAPLAEALASRASFHRLPRLALAELGDTAGCRGAGLLALDALAADAPASKGPASDAPASKGPASNAPASDAPASEAPASEAPASNAPASNAPTSNAPTSNAPTLNAPALETLAADAWRRR